MTTQSTDLFTLSLDEIARVTLDEIRDANGEPIGQNAIVYDTTLTAIGTAAPRAKLWLFDGIDRNELADFASNDSGDWEHTFTLNNFKAYSLFAMEQDPPQNVSTPRKTFFLMDDKPILSTVVGKDGPIYPGDTYDGNWIEIAGTARRGVEIEAFNGDTPLGKKALVDDKGEFNLTLDVLPAGTFNLKIKAPNGRESEVFTFEVTGLTQPHDTRVFDDENNMIEDNGNTQSSYVVVRGSAAPSAQIRLKINGEIEPTLHSTDDNGNWASLFSNLQRNTRYEFIAVASYGGNAESNAWTINVLS